RLIEVGIPLGCTDLPDLPLLSCRMAVELAEQSADHSVPAEQLRQMSEAAMAFSFPGEYYCACYDDDWGPFDGELVASSEAASAASCACVAYNHPSGVIWNIAQAAGYLKASQFGDGADDAAMADEWIH